METRGWREYLKPFLINLASEDYPVPEEGKTYEEMLPKYTFALGQTSAVKKILDFLNQQEKVAETIREKQARRKSYAIGSDDTFEEERRIHEIQTNGEIGNNQERW